MGNPTEQRTSKYQVLTAGKSPIMSASPLSLPNSMALAPRQPAARSTSEVMTPTYGTIASSSNFMSSLAHIGTPSGAFTGNNLPGVYSSPDHTAPAPIRQHSSLTDNIHSEAGAPAIDPSLAAHPVSYNETSYQIPQRPEPGNIRRPAGQSHLAVKSDALQHFSLDVVAPELSQDSAAVLPHGWTHRNQPMVDPNSLPTEQPGYYSMAANYGTAHHSLAEVITSQPASQVADFPSECFICPQAIGTGHKPVFNTLDDYNVHLWKEHSNLLTWTKKKCIWRGCRTKCSFTTAKLWFAHVHQVHQKNVYCTLPNCEYRLGGPNPKPFGSQNGLERHLKSKLHAKPVYCDKLHCTSKQNVARKDKKNLHDTEYHGPFLCPIVDCQRSWHIEGVCYGFANSMDLLAHQAAKHPLEMDDTAIGYGTTTA